MTPADAIALIRRGQCDCASKRAECATCTATEEAMRTLVADGVKRGAEWATNGGRPGYEVVAAERIAREVLP